MAMPGAIIQVLRTPHGVAKKMDAEVTISRAQCPNCILREVAEQTAAAKAPTPQAQNLSNIA